MGEKFGVLISKNLYNDVLTPSTKAPEHYQIRILRKN